MAGVKGRSGRKSRHVEIQEGRLTTICRRWLLENFEKFDDEIKLKVALAMALKAEPTKTQIEQHVEISTAQRAEISRELSVAYQQSLNRLSYIQAAKKSEEVYDDAKQ